MLIITAYFLKRDTELGQMQWYTQGERNINVRHTKIVALLIFSVSDSFSLLFGDSKPQPEVLLHEGKAIPQLNFWFPSQQCLCLCNVRFPLSWIIGSILHHVYLHTRINKLEKKRLTFVNNKTTTMLLQHKCCRTVKCTLDILAQKGRGGGGATLETNLLHCLSKLGHGKFPWKCTERTTR